jgi:2,3-bisphosphoglycerate-independent phosphoglycerate mutase
MFELTLKLNGADDIKEFHKTVVFMDCDVDVIKGSYVIDAKSYIGLLTIDYSTPITVKIHSSDPLLTKRFEKWII